MLFSPMKADQWNTQLSASGDYISLPWSVSYWDEQNLLQRMLCKGSTFIVMDAMDSLLVASIFVKPETQWMLQSKCVCEGTVDCATTMTAPCHARHVRKTRSLLLSILGQFGKWLLMKHMTMFLQIWIGRIRVLDWVDVSASLNKCSPDYKL